HNFDAVSICVAGNFSEKYGIRIESPTVEQKRTVSFLLDEILHDNIDILPFHIQMIPGTIMNVSESSIHHHRFFQTTTK
ncbi:hypothetical protein QCD71_25030, partial [Sphingomonas sp. PsM26]|nr:hypothetical protein [Sphingomonas sp. PsM26]